MDERWDRIVEVYQEALARDAKDRASYLRDVCRDDEPLRLEVEKLLAYDAKAGTFMERSGMVSDITQTLAIEVPLPERVGPYQLGSRLGLGGMGEVYLATDSRLGRAVALKLLLPEMTAHPEARARFLREARSAAALNHPNIATVFDAGESNGRLYLAMEFIEGEPLRSMLRGGSLPENDVLEYGIQLASALDHAHSRGILHRDIKPENVMVERGGPAKLVDFGIAKTIPAETEAATEITNPGMFVGTLKYAPPEVLSGGPANRQSDLYSFGLTLFEMACGQTPFDGLSQMGAIGTILHGDRPTVRDLNAAISEGLSEVIERGMARDPEQRFSTAAEMLVALQAVRDSGGVAAAQRPEVAKVPSLALLEFTNVSRDASLDWLGGGIVETLEGELRKVTGLQVVNRVRTQQVIRGLRLNIEDSASLITLGRRLGAQWIASGSFQRSGNRIRVMTSVLNVSAGEVVSAEKVDGVWDDLFDVQDRVVAALKQALQIETSQASQPRVQPAGAASLDAYEHYAIGRRCMNQMGRDSLGQAKEHFEKAIALDPAYALAYSGLGATYALTFIRSSNLDDLQQARQYLERAIDLDSELGEPYPWLCYLYGRMGEAGKALAAGEKGVKLQPDLSIANYFYGGSLLVAVEGGLGSYQKGLASLTQALILDPQMGASWMLTGFGALLTGQYQTAQWLFEGASRIEKSPVPHHRFIGASTMLGFVHSRQLDWEAARRLHQESIEAMRASEHVYREAFTALSANGLGEIELRNAHPEQASTHFRHAWRIVKEQPRMLGNARLGIRAQAGMAAAYATLGENDKAERHLAEARSRMGGIDTGSWVWDTLLCQLHYSVAAAQLRLGLTADAISSLSRAIDTGFADPSWLELDPEWLPLRERKDFRLLVERVRLIPQVIIDLSRIPYPEFATSTAGTAPPS